MGLEISYGDDINGDVLHSCLVEFLVDREGLDNKPNVVLHKTSDRSIRIIYNSAKSSKSIPSVLTAIRTDLLVASRDISFTISSDGNFPVDPQVD